MEDLWDEYAELLYDLQNEESEENKQETGE